MKLFIFMLCLIAFSVSESIKETFLQRHRSGNWGEGISSNACYNIDYLIRLQRTVDYLDVFKIVEIGFGDWKLNELIHFEDKQYIGYEIVDNLARNVPLNIELKYIQKVQDITQSGDLLVIKDVLMYLPNADIDYVLNSLAPKYRYALIEISSSDQDHNDILIGEYRPLKLLFHNGVKVIEKRYKNTRKQTWLIRNK